VDRNAAEYEELWERCYPQVYAYALRRADQQTAQDVVAETFLVAWRRSDEVPPDAIPWLLGVARHVLANHRRGRRRQAALADVLLDHSLAYSPGPDVDREFLTALASLSDDDREVLILTSWDGLSLREAGRVLGISAASVGVRVFRARNRLRVALSPEPARDQLQPEEGQV
jgi:RNA polymerase sigma factor (sigma-70 family)